MQDNAQLNFKLATAEQVRQVWAFAKAKNAAAHKRRRKAMAGAGQAVITSCSKQAKILGIQVGMSYNDAKRLLPELKILVIGA
jgi:phosphoheptose isomerase